MATLSNSTGPNRPTPGARNGVSILAIYKIDTTTSFTARINTKPNVSAIFQTSKTVKIRFAAPGVFYRKPKKMFAEA